MHCARITRRGSDARPCSQGYSRRAVDFPLGASVGINATNDHAARLDKCQLAASCQPRCRPVMRTGERMKRPMLVAIEYARGCDRFALAKKKLNDWKPTRGRRPPPMSPQFALDMGAKKTPSLCNGPRVEGGTV